MASSVFIEPESNDATAERSYRSIIVQLYRIFPLDNRIYVKSVHHILFFASAVKFCFKRLGNILLGCGKRRLQAVGKFFLLFHGL